MTSLDVNATVRMVFFDVGGTVLRVQPSVGEVYSRTAADHGFDVESGWLGERFKAAWKESIRRSWARSHVCSGEILRDEWFTVVRDTFGSSVPDPHLRPLFEDLYEKFVSASAWSLVAGARETFERLRSWGIRLGVLSNWDSRLPRTLEQLGLDHYFEVVVISYEVGYEKPHRKIFDEAVRRAGEPPARVLHVGDSWESDIEPARQYGLRTLWVASESERQSREEPGPATDDFAVFAAAEWESLLQGTAPGANGFR